MIILNKAEEQLQNIVARPNGRPGGGRTLVLLHQKSAMKVSVPISTEHIKDPQMIDSLIGHAIGDVVLSLIGRFCLYVRFWNKYKVKKELIAKYDNSFSMAGATLIWLFVAWVLLIGISVGLMAILYGIIKALLMRV